MGNITEAVQLMDCMKKLYLKIEFLGLLNQLHLSEEIYENITDMDELVDSLRKSTECMEALISESIVFRCISEAYRV